MKVKHWGLAVLVLLLSLRLVLPIGTVHGQTAHDLLTYSHQLPQMTPRSLALGNTVGSLGGDASCMSVNPAGIGLYRRWDMSVSMGFDGLTGTTRDLNSGMLTRTLGFNYNFNNFGLVIPIRMGGYDSTRVFRGMTFGVNVNRVADFSRQSVARGYTTDPNTMLDALADMGNRMNLTPNDLLASSGPDLYNLYLVQAYETYALDADSLSGKFVGFAAPLRSGSKVFQEQSYNSHGYIYDVGFSFAFNLYDRLFFGATFSGHVLDHGWTKMHLVRNHDGGAPSGDLDQTMFEERNHEEGAGFNLKFGMLAHVHPAIRVGLAFHSPTYMRLHSEQDFKVSTRIYDMAKTGEVSRETEFRYAFLSPMRAMASVTGLFGRWGLLSVDYQAVFSPMTRFFRTLVNSSNTDEAMLVESNEFDADNQYLRDVTQVSHQVSMGGELLLGWFAFRAGGGIMTSPYRVDYRANGLGFRWYASGGLGVSLGSHWYFDFSLQYMPRRYEYPLYDFGSSEFAAYAHSDSNIYTFMAGMGLRF